jgi:phosphorylcholine metabolism protein LicD
LAWGIVEFELNNIILKEYSVSSSDPKAEILLNLRFIDKLNLQRNLGFLNQEKYDTVLRFSQERNRFFHSWSKNWQKYPSLALFILGLSPLEKEEIMDMAIEAARVVHGLFDHVFR